MAKLEIAGMDTNLTGPTRNISEIIDMYHNHKISQSKFKSKQMKTIIQKLNISIIQPFTNSIIQ